MVQDVHTVEELGGSQFKFLDRVLLGAVYDAVNKSSAGPIASVGSITAGSYATIPTLSVSGDGTGAVLVPVMKAISATVVTPQSSTGNYVPNDTITLTGGTQTANAVLTVDTTLVQSATVNAGGSGGTNGTQTVTGTTGTGTKFQASVTVSGGAITAVLSITVSGSYTVNPTSLTAEPVTGAGLSGATLTLKMGVATCHVTTAGSYTVLPSNPVAQGSTSGSGTGATFTVLWGLLSVTVSNGGSGYNNTSALVVSGGGSTGGAAGTLALTNTGNAVTTAVTALANLPATYTVHVTPNQACFVSVTSKTSTGFNVVLTPLAAGTISAGTFDYIVVA